MTHAKTQLNFLDNHYDRNEANGGAPQTEPLVHAPMPSRAELDKMTVAEARALLHAHGLAGTCCMTCDQPVKYYLRAINYSMARALILLYHECARNGGEFVKVNEMLMAHGVEPGPAMVPLLRHWDLVEKEPGARADGAPTTGKYRVTSRGRAFVEGRISVLKFICLYNNERMRERESSTATASIRDALAGRFDYNELMRRGS